MKIFLSSLENSACGKGKPDLVYYLLQDGIKMKWNLMSYYYLRSEKNFEQACVIRDNSEAIMIDSGAHTFQFGAKVDFVEYTKQYAEFIKRFDRPNVLGYFEMDADNVFGYDKVLELRRILENVSDKIIPVWHTNRGIQDYIDTCKQYSGRIVAITGFANKDIRDDQYIMFVKIARQYNCRIHCLGMTRKKVLDTVPFDYTDSSSWKQHAIFGRIGQGTVSRDFYTHKREIVFKKNYLSGMEMQEAYYRKWQKVNKD